MLLASASRPHGVSRTLAALRQLVARSATPTTTAPTTRSVATADGPVPSSPAIQPAPLPVPVPPFDPASSGRLQLLRRSLKPPRPAPEAPPVPDSASAPGAPAPRVSPLKRFGPTVVADLQAAIAAKDPVLAWQCYYALTNLRKATLAPRADVGRAPWNAKLFRAPVPPRASSPVAGLLPREVHGQMLLLVKSLTNYKFAKAAGLDAVPLYLVTNRVEHILATMRRLEVPLQSTDEFTALIDLYARAGQVKRMEFWFQQFLEAMARQQYGDDLPTDLSAALAAVPVPQKIANSVLSGYVNAHRVDDALRWYDLAVAKYHLEPNAFTYFHLMRLLVRAGAIVSLDKLFALISHEIGYEANPFAALVTTVNHPAPTELDAEPAPPTTVFDLDRALDILSVTPRPEADVPGSLDAHAYAHMIQAHGQHGDLLRVFEHTRAYLATHARRPVARTRHVLDMFVGALCRHDQVRAAERAMALYPTFGCLKKREKLAPGARAHQELMLALGRRGEVTRATAYATRLLERTPTAAAVAQKYLDEAAAAASSGAVPSVSLESTVTATTMTTTSTAASPAAHVRSVWVDAPLNPKSSPAAQLILTATAVHTGAKPADSAAVVVPTEDLAPVPSAVGAGRRTKPRVTVPSRPRLHAIGYQLLLRSHVRAHAFAGYKHWRRVGRWARELRPQRVFRRKSLAL
ncbi:pentatricopeptide repeat domain-containing protein [Allomyces macrogynus ATCC 38327]|uniref:Pentatricopeptide repeat domain-containing protein n=1 Tax=Allomyces macrogynus (strain ATCC 38327) TaxID=578462 RepID=A0A0L0SG65_ALLM3|nr:pentatricopeptide repeat domain-containing protein [Allomyces macrogynus ATCC 38327]|eukprot:KNE61380.1 pentatricopeptide repeat domain-containing protein [Allomyces macrogynus ATCC 38327]